MTRHDPTAPPAPLDGALVRLPLRGDRWAEDLPPVPRGYAVTVSFASAEAADLHGDALRLLGYDVVGVHPRGSGEATSADVLVPQALLENRPRWWRALTAHADRTFGLGFGPVLHALADVLRLHTAGRAR